MQAEQQQFTDADSIFAQHLGPFLETLTFGYQKLQALFDRFKQSFEQACRLFGDDPKKTRPEELLEPIITFAKTFDRLTIEFNRRLERESLSKKRKEVCL